MNQFTRKLDSITTVFMMSNGNIFAFFNWQRPDHHREEIS